MMPAFTTHLLDFKASASVFSPPEKMETYQKHLQSYSVILQIIPFLQSIEKLSS